MTEQDAKLSVLGICGSLRTGSYCLMALEYVSTLLKQLGCDTKIIDLRRTVLPFCNGEENEAWHGFPAVAELRQAVAQAHALVLVTPEYHGSVSGVLKNALDLVDRRCFDGKVVGVMSVLGGPANGSAINDLSGIMRSCHAWVIPQRISIGRSHRVFVNGRITDTDLQLRFEKFAESLMRSSIRLCGLN
jgi:FMN reductase